VASLQLWHERLGHVNVAGVKRMIKNKDIDGLKWSSMAVTDVCEPCVHGKAAMTPIPSAGGCRVTKRLQLVHSDVGGPISEPSRGGALYFCAFTDEFSGWTDVDFLQKKSDLFAECKKWLTQAQLQTGRMIKVLRCHNGGEYLSNAFKSLSTMRTARRTRPRCLTRHSTTESLRGSTEFSWRWLAP